MNFWQKRSYGKKLLQKERVHDGRKLRNDRFLLEKHAYSVWWKSEDLFLGFRPAQIYTFSTDEE